MHNTLPHFHSLLEKILNTIKLTDKEKARFQKNYDLLVAKRMTLLLLDTIKDNKEKQEVLRNLLTNVDGTQEKDLTHNVVRLYEVLDSLLAPQEKVGFYVFSNFSVLLELLEPILTKGTEKENAVIGDILANEEGFLDVFATAQQALTNS